ncbi:hypothetical protein EDD85DRAFT_855852 [Armillaria nabsnona]|nr:hypothetical protein EDD85DRAFT_855852 [Armillaria nabsnona]
MDNLCSPALPSFDCHVLCCHSPLLYAISSLTTLVSPGQPRLIFLSGSMGRLTSFSSNSGSCSMMTASRHHLCHFLLAPVFSPPNIPSENDVTLSAPRLAAPTHTRLLSAPTAYGRFCLPLLSVIPPTLTSAYNSFRRIKAIPPPSLPTVRGPPYLVILVLYRPLMKTSITVFVPICAGFRPQNTLESPSSLQYCLCANASKT